MQFQEFLNSLGYDAVFFTQPVYMTLNRLSMGQRGLRQAVRCMMYEGSNAHVTSLTDVHASSNLPFRSLDWACVGAWTNFKFIYNRLEKIFDDIEVTTNS